MASTNQCEEEKFAENIAKGFKIKADHNKKEALFCFLLAVTGSLSTPLFVMLADTIVLGKIVPSIISLTVAGSTAWLQLRKPQNLWALYRDCQRRIEDDLYRYRYKLDDHEDETMRRRVLAESVRNVAWDAHQKWLPFVPSPESIGGHVAGAVVTFEGEKNDGRKHSSGR